MNQRLSFVVAAVGISASSSLGCFDLEGVPDRSESISSNDDNIPDDADPGGESGDDGSEVEEEPIEDDDADTDRSLQQEALDEGRILLADSSGITIDPETLAVSGIDPVSPVSPLPDGFEPAPFYGAVDPDLFDGEAWWQGWTVIDSRFDGNLPGEDFHPLRAEIEGGTLLPSATNQCSVLNPDFGNGGEALMFGVTFPVCMVDQRITADTTLSNDHIFVLKGSVNVGNGDLRGAANNDVGATLTIERGTQIYAAAETQAILVVTRGSRIQANGTEDLPIIMGATSLEDDGLAIAQDDDLANLSDRGQWGGLVLSGNAPTNEGFDLPSAASPANATRWYGGSIADDNSGRVEYVIVAEGGLSLLPDSDIQGITLEATGSETMLDYIQVIGTDDDCVEWFGGSSRMSHLVCVGVDDDGLDIDDGYRGRIQYVIVRMGDQHGGSGIESDNNFSDFFASPISDPDIANVLILGRQGRGTTFGAVHQEGFAGRIHRSVFTDDTLVAGAAFNAGCLNINDVIPASFMHLDSVFNCSGGDSNGLSLPDD